MVSKGDGAEVGENKKQKKRKNNEGETERQRRRREKEESKEKEKLSLQKQADIMYKFLNRTKTSDRNDQHFNTKIETPFDSATLSMDATLHSGPEFSSEDIRKAQISMWRDLSKSVRSKRSQRWGIRLKPKFELYKELKLRPTVRVAHYGDLILEEHAERSLLDVKMNQHGKQLFQFDHSPRPAFYGIWDKKSQVVGPRHPFRKDSILDYDVDSDEEWKEVDPGESLSGYDQDEEECSTSDYEICGGYFVPDGYLSEDEGAHVDKMETNVDIDGAENLPKGKDDVERDEFCALLQQQKNLNNLIKIALGKNKPLIITNFMHEMRSGQDNGTIKSEQIWLQYLSFHVISAIDISVNHFQDEDQKRSSGGSVAPVCDDDAIPESNLPLIVAAIQTYPRSLSKVLKSLKRRFPSASKHLLKDKVCEISNYVDNCLQVKKEVLVKLGLDQGCSKSESRSRTVHSSRSCFPSTSDILKPGDNKKKQT
ncbi:chromatin assembly factor 1 subunit FAS1 isoform X2 [Arachis ipaensis]|uniref:chromatin assembly factor 1 subunit FAS1 isoform X2 n=1 Tax=Arachis ipaensis TaxID=130454 RepID=UPI0007AF2FD7|nr:chromatin assembly factor 1 subunit FAS1 isoform X2 [Arachis ipaensis]XP_025675681.1 chromatin assembly factor 1 subunit FAS1 isoform X2 [Arachis hypogaea]